MFDNYITDISIITKSALDENQIEQLEELLAEFGLSAIHDNRIQRNCFDKIDCPSRQAVS